MKYIKNFNSINESNDTQLDIKTVSSKYQPSGSVFVAYNTSRHNYEYDSDLNYAIIYMIKKSGDLVMNIIKHHIKSGIGKGITTKEVGQIPVGNIRKPDTKAIQEYINKNNFKRDRFTTPFGRDRWSTSESGDEMTITDILKLDKFQRVAKLDDMGAGKMNKEELITDIKKKISDMSIEELEKLYDKL